MNHMPEQHSIRVERYRCGDNDLARAADRMDPEHEWFCTCGATDIVSGRSPEKARRAATAHLADAHGQT